MFSQISSFFNKLFGEVAQSFRMLCGRRVVDETLLSDLRQLCINADMGPAVTNMVIAQVRAAAQSKGGVDITKVLQATLLQALKMAAPYEGLAPIIMIVGVNGSGKTTTGAKLAARAHAEGKKVLLVAADTFRAAAVEQLQRWAEMVGVTCITGSDQQDPSSVIFAACAAWKLGVYDCMIIDTAGRLQTKSHLMEELAKMRRVLSKQLSKASVSTLLTLDSMLGQNSFEQARLFHEAVKLDGIVLTKYDGTGQGGIVFQVVQEFKVPIAYLATGEQAKDLMVFQPEKFVNALLTQE